MAIDIDPQAEAAPGSRRSLLAAALGGLAATAAAALGRPQDASAAAGSNLILGSQANNAGTADTQLLANSSVIAFKLLQSGQGTALMGHATALSGGTRGVYGRTDSPNGDGVQARSGGAAGSGAAMRAFGGNNVGLESTTASASKVAIHAANSAVDGTVALFENTSGGISEAAGPAIRAYTGGGSNAHVHPSGGWDAAGEFAGPMGVIGAATGNGYGVNGFSPGDSGRGVSGVASGGVGVYGYSSTGIGVHGFSNNNAAVRGDSSTSSGVRGDSASGDGVYGDSTNGSGVLGTSFNAVGVYGYSANSSAGYFEGHLYASSLNAGSVSAAVKNFRIDHPQDPAGKVLMHSCVESSERLTVYAGTVTTDATGEAVIELPAYIDALNRDLSYQLTPLADVRAWVKRKVAGNRFTVATSEPRTEVSWQVTGVRQDAYAKAHPLVVEAAKTGKEKGKYLNPAEHGQPESKGVDYELRRAARRDSKLPS
jgi:hypothetical protein